MATIDEKKSVTPVAHEVSNEGSQDGEGPHVEVVKGSEALAAAIRKENPSPWTPNLFKLYAFCILTFLCSTMNG